MTSDPPFPLDLLVLGGTSWLGGAVAQHALARGHRVTCLARGESGTPPDGVSWVRADRSAAGAYTEVASCDWNVVLDVSWQPDLVRSALAALAERARHWVYVSSCSVYADDSVPGEDEDAALHAAHPGSGVVPIEAYGPAKVACEEVFGPVVTVTAYDSLDEAIALANGTRYGLQAGIFTARIDSALRAGRELEFGGVTVNEAPTFRADQMPYGGVKDSGNTREGPAWAVRELTEETVVVVELP